MQCSGGSHLQNDAAANGKLVTRCALTTMYLAGHVNPGRKHGNTCISDIMLHGHNAAAIIAASDLGNARMGGGCNYCT